jgi:hypothetical protein
MNRLDAILIAGVLAVFLLFVHERIPAGPYSYDESDYMYAASLGFWSNYADTPSRPVAEMVRVGLRYGMAEERRTELSAYARGTDDVNFYRHFHGPLYSFWLVLMSPWKHNEQAMRTFTLVFPILTFLAIYAGALWLLGLKTGRLAAVLAGSLFLWSYPTIASAELVPHQLLVLCYTASLLGAAKALQTGERRYWYAAVAAAGVTFATLGVAFVLLPVLAFVAWLERRRLAVDGKFAYRSAGVFLAALLMTWPASILKLSILKSYIFMVYLAVFRRLPWGETTFLDTWRVRFFSSPVDWILLAAGVLVYWRWRNLPERRAALPLLVFGGLMLLTLLRMKTEGVRYLTPFLPALQVFAGFTLGGALAAWRSRARYAVLAALCALIAWNTARQVSAHPLPIEPRPAALLAAVRGQGLAEKALLVPQGDVPVLHYYFPRTRLKGYLEESAVSAELAARSYDAVLYPGYPVRLWAPERAGAAPK